MTHLTPSEQHAMKRCRPLGSVNGYWPSHFTLRGKRYNYPGTTLQLTLAALQAGARVGDTVTDEFGYTYTLAAQGGGERTPGGVWMRRVL